MNGPVQNNNRGSPDDIEAFVEFFQGSNLIRTIPNSELRFGSINILGKHG